MWGRNPPCYKIGTNPYSACPEFRQNENFVSVLWRREVDDATGQVKGLVAGNETSNETGNEKSYKTLTRLKLFALLKNDGRLPLKMFF